MVVDMTLHSWQQFNFVSMWREESSKGEVSETVCYFIDFDLTRPPLLCGLLLPTPSLLLLFVHLCHLLLVLGNWLPVVGALGWVLLKFPAILRLGMVKFAMRTLWMSSSGLVSDCLLAMASRKVLNIPIIFSICALLCRLH